MIPDAPSRMPYPLPRREVRVVPTGRAAEVRRAILRARVVRAYVGGSAVSKVAASLGVSESFVYHSLAAAGVPLRPRPLGITRGRRGYVPR